MYRANRVSAASHRAPVSAGQGAMTAVRTSAAGELRSTLRSRGLTIAYQPIINLHTGRITAMEALARWTTPSGASIAPDVFIPMAEESGLIGELGSQILTMAVRDAATWQSIAPTGVRVNVSAHELRSPTFYGEVMRTVDKVGLDPTLLGLEVTEAILLEGDAAAATLGRLRLAGVSLMLDDFGTGASSLSHLEDYPVIDMLKIDRSALEDGRPGEQLVEAVVRLGRAYDLKVCAEGVESAAQHARIVELGCDFAQGYHFARPTTRDLAPRMLQAWAPFLPVKTQV